ncbi:MAG: SDR family oxidoreductase [Gammaproteobacteria bacterium]|jgi:dTDP-4-dehydrorhamnose reductase|nr:SDR family oxidoreductase [Gammaproteobacteria bacterium]
MRVLILGGDGMLGHQLFKHLGVNHDVRVALRRELDAYRGLGLFKPDNSYAGIDAQDIDALIGAAADFCPQAIINAIGIVKQRDQAKAYMPSLEINALLPHRLALLCKAIRARLVHMSTDCVFSGRKGAYTEADPSDAEDLYGKSKFLGELHDEHCVTLRTSIIGLELNRKTGLIEWFLSQKGNIKGFRRAVYTGFTTAEMARVIERVLIKHTELHGVWHVASTPISKYELLCLLADKLKRTDVEIEPDDNFVCDRGLAGARFARATGYDAPNWDTMLGELAQQVLQRGTTT